MTFRRSPEGFVPVVLLILLAIAFGWMALDGSDVDSEDGLELVGEAVANEESRDAHGDLPLAVAGSEEAVGSELLEEPKRENEREAVEGTSNVPLIVQVHDPDGNPVPDLPLIIRRTPPTRSVKELREMGFEVQFTDGSGRAVFPDGDQYRENPGGLWIYHLVAFNSLPRTRLDKEIVSQEVIESIQPRFGSIEVPVIELNGELANNIASVKLQRVSAEERLDLSLAKKRRTYRVNHPKGVATFPFVELGGNWRVEAKRTDTGLETPAEGMGPVRHKEIAQLPIRIGSNRPVVKVRLIGPDQTIIRSTVVQVESKGGIFGTTSHTHATDADGVLWLEVEGELLEFRPPSLTMTVHPENESSSVSGTLGPLSELVNGMNDLGDLQLVRNQVLVSGTVYDEMGPVIGGVKIALGSSVEGMDVNAPQARGKEEPRTTTSDEEGRFQFLGRRLPKDAELWAFIDTPEGRKQSEIVAVEGIGSDVKLHLRRAFVPTVKLLLPDYKNSQKLAKRINLVVTPTGEAEEPLHAVQQIVTNRGGVEPLTNHYRFQGVFGGRFNVRCTFMETDFEETLLMETLDVPVVRDGPLVTYDLRELLYVHRLKLVDPQPEEDQKIEGTYRVMVQVPMTSAEEGEEPKLDGYMEDWRSSDFKSRTIEILTTQPSVDVQVLPASHRAERVDGLSGERELLLRPPLRVRLVLVSTGKVPDLPYTFDPMLYLNEDRIGKSRGSRWFTDEDRECVFLLPTAGRITVKWHLEKEISNGAIGGEVLYGHRQHIDVLDTRQEQRFELHLDAKALTSLAEKPPF